jgi:N-methylhydantoinase A
MRVATDVGGTFTDLVYQRGDIVGSVKVNTTAPDFDAGVLNSLDSAALEADDIEFLVHGSTVVINALTERRGARTGLITTRGFRDVLEIARGNTPDLYNLRYKKPEPFIPRRLRQEITERIDYQGRVLQPVQLSELDAIIRRFLESGVESVAVCLLHSYANPLHERLVCDLLRRKCPAMHVIASCDVSQEWREYERTNTAALSSYVMPVTTTYLNRLEGSLRSRGLKNRPYIMQSNGGIASFHAAGANPISLVESGPASGMLGALAVGRVLGERNLIALDIGGTTAKSSLISGGEVRVTSHYSLEKSAVSPGYPLLTPVIDIVEIGTGGGSIAWTDAGRALHVGPRSAGAQPGPAAYGRGGQDPTITDANLLTGRIDRTRFSGGQSDNCTELAHAAYERLGSSLGVTAEQAANGTLRIANANMVNALKLVSLNRGYDPREFTLMAFGGGGGLHAVELARELNIPKVIIPPLAAVFSAWAMLTLDIRRDFVATRPRILDAAGFEAMREAFADLEATARLQLEADDVAADRMALEYRVDARYLGQEHTVKVSVPSAGGDEDGPRQQLIERFHQQHEREYTFRLQETVEVVNCHLTAFGLLDKLDLRPISPRRPLSKASGSRTVDFGTEGPMLATVYSNAEVGCGQRIEGPAVIDDSASATVIPSGAAATMDEYGALHIGVFQ